MPLTRQELAAICDTYITAHPELEDPDKAVGRCEWDSQVFCATFPKLNAKPLAALGYRTAHPHRHAYWSHYPDPDDCLAHHVCQVGSDWVVDLTYKQLDTPYPTAYCIQSFTEFSAEWLLLAEDYDKHIEPMRVIGTLLLQG